MIPSLALSFSGWIFDAYFFFLSFKQSLGDRIGCRKRVFATLLRHDLHLPQHFRWSSRFHPAQPPGVNLIVQPQADSDDSDLLVVRGLRNPQPEVEAVVRFMRVSPGLMMGIGKSYSMVQAWSETMHQRVSDLRQDTEPLFLNEVLRHPLAVDSNAENTSDNQFPISSYANSGDDVELKRRGARVRGSGGICGRSIRYSYFILSSKEERGFGVDFKCDFLREERKMWDMRDSRAGRMVMIMKNVGDERAEESLGLT
ncbi:hypothetical protein BDN70DRAFT_900670 [Pholiota conissans]|uniref:Uncharacterized protein n=1 Tax=Pholiota conissans TaxID=109636 RepID=A0A9P6CSN6_9AGAR|nr:hypothetical protein BDN70DRAFT_900670 [Pholiota conissans]